MTSEGLGLLYGDLIRQPEPSRHIEERVMPLMAAAHPRPCLPTQPRSPVNRGCRYASAIDSRTYRCEAFGWLRKATPGSISLWTAHTRPWSCGVEAMVAVAREAPHGREHRLDVRCGPRRVERDLLTDATRLTSP